MLNDTKKDLVLQARTLTKPYESYSIDELADAYCDAIDNKNEKLKNVYCAALMLRFWYTIDKMYKSNTVAPCLEREDFFWWLYEAIEYACKYRGWRDPDKKLNAQQCINKCINTIKLQKYYDLRLDKNKTVNYCVSLETPLSGSDGDDAVKTLGDTFVGAEDAYDDSGADMVRLVQKYINNNKLIEAVLIDNIVNNDVQRHFKRTVKAIDTEGNPYKYIEHSSEFWPYKLVQIVSKLPATYKKNFMKRYDISEEKLNAALTVIDKANNQKLYRYLRKMLAELKESYAT
jgi:hypothetical protein